jgi:hypothetical protein
MKSQNLFLISLLAFGALGSASIILSEEIEEPGPSEEVEKTGDGSLNRSSGLADSSEIRTTSEGRKFIVHPGELVQGCPGKDCIPSIDNPSFEEGSVEWLEGDARVIGLEVNGDARAYPLKILSKHEIVNDEVGGEPVAVTYCPLCRSGVTYSRVVNGEVLEFGVSGKLLDANLVMYDRSSESYWNQITGEAIIGPRTSQELELKFSSITTWDKWKEGHPDTKVLSRKTGVYPVSTYNRNSYNGYSDSERVGFGVSEVDDRLPSKELVYGISLGNNSKAFTEKSLRQEKIIQDKIGSKNVVIIERPSDGAATAFLTEENRSFSLESEGLRDSQGDLWNFEGREVNGGGEMTMVNPQGFYWFAWSKFHPNTELYKQENKK